jgi:hypothetical protein
VASSPEDDSRLHDFGRQVDDRHVPRRAIVILDGERRQPPYIDGKPLDSGRKCRLTSRHAT